MVEYKQLTSGLQYDWDCGSANWLQKCCIIIDAVTYAGSQTVASSVPGNQSGKFYLLLYVSVWVICIISMATMFTWPDISELFFTGPMWWDWFLSSYKPCWTLAKNLCYTGNCYSGNAAVCLTRAEQLMCAISQVVCILKICEFLIQILFLST